MDPCKDKKDGNYEVRDTFGYLECKGGKGTQKMCEEGDIFVTSPSKECVKADVKYMGKNDLNVVTHCNQYVKKLFNRV